MWNAPPGKPGIPPELRRFAGPPVRRVGLDVPLPVEPEPGEGQGAAEGVVGALVVRKMGLLFPSLVVTEKKSKKKSKSAMLDELRKASAEVETEKLLKRLRKTERRNRVLQVSAAASVLFGLTMLSPFAPGSSAPGTGDAAAVASAQSPAAGKVMAAQAASAEQQGGADGVAWQGLKLATQLQAFPISEAVDAKKTEASVVRTPRS